MHYLNLTRPSPAENLALDEALLDGSEKLGTPQEWLRTWEPEQMMVVLGRSSKVSVEVHESVCVEENVPILRRISGGATIVAGPGCLMYALVLSYERRPALRSIDQTHRFVLGVIARELRKHVPEVRCRGISDLVVGSRKFSGNSVRCKRQHLLYHGTLLYDFPLDQITRFLAMPPREPDYRNARQHESFVMNLPIDRATLCEALRQAFDATEQIQPWPERRTAQLLQERYNNAKWHEEG